MAIMSLKRTTLKTMTCRRELLRLSLLILLGFSLSGAIGLRAQEQPARPQKQQKADDTEKHQGLQQQLVRREREAAGEEEKDEAGQETPALAADQSARGGRGTQEAAPRGA